MIDNAPQSCVDWGGAFVCMVVRPRWGRFADREESNIRRHIINVFADEELIRENNVQNLHVNGVSRKGDDSQ